MASLDAKQTLSQPVSLRAATAVWARIGLLSFGGPAGQIALMHRELVDERRWISDARFLHALNYCMLLPGPEAQQLAVYIGWLMHRTIGGIIAGVLFVLPGFLTILALSALYVTYGDLPWVSAVFYGIKAAILAIVLEAVLRIGKRALKHDALLAIAGLAFLAIYFLAVPFPVVIVAAALFGALTSVTTPSLLPVPALQDGNSDATYVVDSLIAAGALTHIAPNRARFAGSVTVWLGLWLAPVGLAALILGPGHIFTTLGVFFTKAATVTFGGAYAVLAYVAQQAVETFGWMSAGEMVDGLALAETTPGPLVLVLEFVSYLAAARADTGLGTFIAGALGAAMTTWVTFAPSFLWIFAGAPYIETLRGHRVLHAALSCITAAVVGTVLNLSIWLSIHVLFADVDEIAFGRARLLIPHLESIDIPSLLIAVGSAVALLRFHFGLGKTLLTAATVGFIWRMFLN